MSDKYEKLDETFNVEPVEVEVQKEDTNAKIEKIKSGQEDIRRSEAVRTEGGAGQDPQREVHQSDLHPQGALLAPDQPQLQQHQRGVEEELQQHRGAHPGAGAEQGDVAEEAGGDTETGEEAGERGSEEEARATDLNTGDSCPGDETVATET